MNDTLPAVGFVYLIEQNGEYKIGHSADPERRLPQVADPERARILHVIPSASPPVIEHALHRRFSLVHLRGEWFALSEADVDLILSVSRTDAVDDLPPELIADPDAKNPTRGRKSSTNSKQINVRLSQQILDDIALIERAHGLDTSSAIRMILTEARHPIVQRARKILEERGEDLGDE